MAQQLINVGAVANDGTGDTWRDALVKVNANETELFSAILANRVVVTQASDLAGTLSSDVEYFIDGTVDMGSQSISVPAGGIHIKGFNLILSQLISTASSYTMFVSPVGNSGGVQIIDLAIETSGSGSQVYDLTDATGFNAVEVVRVNYNNCTSLGTLNGYRQGLETGTGRFGGSPELTLAGTWIGGFFIDTSIIRSLTNSAFTLYKAGGSFTMASRFRSNQNLDLPALASFLDFAPSNFPNSSTLQLDGCIVTRNGVSDASDTNLTPNISAGDLASSWNNNNGLPNTFEGGELNITSEITSTISTINVFVDLAGTYASSDLEHFDSPSNGQLRHLGSSPVDYKVSVDIVLDGGANDEADIKIVIFRDATSSDEDAKVVRRVINNLQGGRNVAYFNFFDNITLNKNDYVRIQVANASDTSNMTAELDSSFTVEAR